MTPVPQEVSQLLRAWSDGDQDALDQLVPLVYEDLRQMAKRYMERQNPGHTLQTTAIIHEAYLRLVEQRQIQRDSRALCCAVAARVMRRILVHYAGARCASNRAGAGNLVRHDGAALASYRLAAELVAIVLAVERLGGVDL